MEMRVLGNTGLAVSRIGLGMASLGRPGYINLKHGEDLAGDYGEAAMERRAHLVLDSAWNAGLRYFDVARSYGLVEKFLGSWLTSRSVSPSSVTVGSKWGYTYMAGWKVQAESHEIKEHTLPVLQRQWGESVALLNGYLDLYQIHSATTPGFDAKRALLQKEAAKFDSSIDAIALASCLAQPFADVVLSGATTVERMLSNLESYRLDLDEEAITRLSVLTEPTEQYWATRAKLPWN
jgi:aryl-alcohol dehydrogenase-like predicted oxidoreductase